MGVPTLTHTATSYSLERLEREEAEVRLDSVRLGDMLPGCFLRCCYIGCALPLHEKALLARVRRAVIRSGVDLDGGTGIGDDCAVIKIPRGHEALITTDFSLENVHFRRTWHPPDSVGHRCLTRGLSDIAAMGGVAGGGVPVPGAATESAAELGGPILSRTVKTGRGIQGEPGGWRHGRIPRRHSGGHCCARIGPLGLGAPWLREKEKGDPAIGCAPRGPVSL